MRVTRTPDRLLSGNDRMYKSAAIRLGWKHEHIHRNTHSARAVDAATQVAGSVAK